jgi:hypothetical protein
MGLRAAHERAHQVFREERLAKLKGKRPKLRASRATARKW